MSLLERTRTVELMPDGNTLEEAVNYAGAPGEEIEFTTERPVTTITERTVLGNLADKLAALTGKGNA